MVHNIAFPGLGLSFTIPRIAFSVFGKDIYWYGIIICCGFLLAAYYVSRRLPEFGLNVDQLVDVILWAIPISLIFARAYYVLFQWDAYKAHPIDAIKIWNGGIAIYGSLIGAILVIVVYCRLHKLSIPNMLDTASIGLLIGQFVGRWGNFVNAEAHGGPTTLPWRMSIDGAAGVHPTFFYESLWNFIGFILLHFHSKKRHFRGELFLCYLAWYGFGRMIIEGLRTDSLYVPGTGIRISQVVAAVTLLVSVVLLILGYRKYPARLSDVMTPAEAVRSVDAGPLPAVETPAVQPEKQPEEQPSDQKTTPEEQKEDET